MTDLDKIIIDLMDSGQKDLADTVNGLAGQVRDLQKDIVEISAQAKISLTYIDFLEMKIKESKGMDMQKLFDEWAGVKEDV